jgi:flagellar basal body-associated protein FliL
VSAPAANPEQEAPPKKGPGMIVWILVSAISAGAGFAVPMLMGSPKSHGSEKSEEEKVDAAHAAQEPKEREVAVVPYGMIDVNLNENRLAVFLRLKINLVTDKTNEKKVAELLEQKRLMLQSWMLGHFAEKTLEEVRGEAGQKMMQREILDRFNSVLFSDGIDRVYDVLFEQFNIQQ